MALGLQTIRTAVETRLSTGITGRQVTVLPNPPLDIDGTYPCICVVPGSDQGPYISYFETFSNNGKALVRFTLRLYVSAADQVSAQIAMDAFLSYGSGFTSSILGAFLGDRTLGGAVDDCIILTASAPQPVNEQGQVWVADLPLDVYATKVAA